MFTRKCTDFFLFGLRKSGCVGCVHVQNQGFTVCRPCVKKRRLATPEPTGADVPWGGTAPASQGGLCAQAGISRNPSESVGISRNQSESPTENHENHEIHVQCLGHSQRFLK